MSFHDGAVDQIQTVARLGGQGVKEAFPDAAPRPTIEPVVRRCVRPIALGQIAPRHSSAQHVKYRVHDLPSIRAGTLSAFRHQRLKQSPFVVAEIKSHDPPPSTVNHVRLNYSMSYLGTDPSPSRRVVLLNSSHSGGTTGLPMLSRNATCLIRGKFFK